MQKKELGNLGEKLARRYLFWHGYKILAKNYSTKYGEIDIVCYDRKTKEYVFVEVKTRSANSVKYYLPRQAVNNAKRRHIENSALVWMGRNRIHEKPYRFDVIEVVEKMITHIKNYFV